MAKRIGAIGTAKRLAPRWAKTALLGSVRGFGTATERLRGLPDFLIIGGKRCGTTTLYWHLVQHPCVAPLFPGAKHIKGVHYFDWSFERGIGWYRSHFPSALRRRAVRRRTGHDAVAGEASSSYLFHPHAPARAALVVPEVKVIVLLRDPVDRAWSHYRARVRKEAESLSFEEALAAEPDRLRGERERVLADGSYRSYPLEQQSYASLGLYLEPLTAWRTSFPPEQVLAVRTEDLAAEPEQTYRSVLRFLDLPDWTPSEFRRMNVGQGAMEMAPATREDLAERFTEPNARLAEYLGRSMEWTGG